MKKSIEGKWYQQVWLPFAAGTYVVICIFDFIIMPLYVTAHNNKIENAIFSKLEGKDAITFADTIIKGKQAEKQWNPLTLLGAGTFHLAFGALLTGGAVTRGMAKRSEVEGYYRSGMYEDEEYEVPRRPYRPTYRNTQQGTDGPVKKTEE